MAADKYWLKRLKRDRGLSRRAASAVEAEVKRAYRAQYLQVARRLDELYAEAQARGELSRTKLWNYRTYRSLERQLREFCEAEVLTQREALTKCLDRVFNDVIGADIRTFQQDKFIVRYNPRAVIDTAWSGESYSSRIWKNNEALASRIQSECQQIVMGMKGPETIKRDLMKDFDVSYRQASRLVDTEVSYVLNKANLEQYRAYGFEKITIVNLDVNTCDKCKALEDEVFYIFDAPVLPLHPHCHCSYCVPEALDEAEVTASRGNLEAVYERKGVAQGGKGRAYTPKGAPASANPSALARKIEAVTAAKPEAAKAAKAEKAAEPTPEPKTNPQTSADVQAPKPLPAPEAQAAKSPENTGVLGAEVLPKEAESGIIKTVETPPKFTSAEDVRQWIESSRCSKVLRIGRQRVHIPGTKEYADNVEKYKRRGEYGPSTLALTEEQAEALGLKYMGKGIPIIAQDGWNGTEIVTSNEDVIGQAVNNLTGTVSETSVFKIHYSRRGFHVTPDYPSKKKGGR